MQRERYSRKAAAASITLGWMLAGQVLQGQVMALPASDPVGIARSGAQVAFGRSLEAASLNPALLITLQEPLSAYLGLGMEQESAQVTPHNNQRTQYTTDRNRAILSFGTAWHLRDNVSFGLKLDHPFMRNGILPQESTVRFFGRSLDLNTQRFEFQGAWSPKQSPQLSFGLGIGFVRVKYASSLMVRALLPVDQTQPASSTNTVQDLVEVEVEQRASKTVTSGTLGFRWAINPRWTLGAVYQAPIKGTLSLAANRTSAPPVYCSPGGFGAPSAGVDGSVLLTHSSYQPGQGNFTLPGRMSFGVRQRPTQFLTWEMDLHYDWAGSLRLPEQPSWVTPSGAVSAPTLNPPSRNGLGIAMMAEVALTKRLTTRIGLALDPAIYHETDIRPLTGGAKNAAFSGGLGYLLWGGEFNVGYQFRQSQDHDTSKLDGYWYTNLNALQFRTTGTTTRVEGMGHLWSIGFRKAF